MKRIWPYIALAAVAGAAVALLRRLTVIDITNLLPRASGLTYGSRELDQIRYIVLHHSAIDGYGPMDYARWHIEDNGWPGIGYHFVIQPGGTIYQTNNLRTVSYHVRDHNTPSVGICLSGDLSQHQPTPAQEQALRRLIRKLQQQLPGRVTIHGHREFVSTGCPGMLDVGKYR